MIKNNYFLTAALGREYLLPASRLIRQVKAYKILENIYCLTEENFENLIDYKYKKILNKYKIQYRKGFIWKPWYILSILEKLEYGNVLLYLDAGCELSDKGISELRNIISNVEKNGSIYFSNGLNLYDWCDPACKEDLISLYGQAEEVESVVGGVLFLRKDSETIRQIRSWAYASLYKNGILFLGFGDANHRHDQTALTFILNNNKIKLSSYPIWFDEWKYGVSTTYHYPIHTLRNKSKYQFLPYRSTLIYKLACSLGQESLLCSVQKKILELRGKYNLCNVVEPEFFAESFITRQGFSGVFKTAGDTRTNNSVRYLSLPPIKKTIVFKNGDIYIKDYKVWLLGYRRLYGNTNFCVKWSNLVWLLIGFVIESKDKFSAMHCLNENSNNLYHFLYDCYSLRKNYDVKLKYLVNEGLTNLKSYFIENDNNSSLEIIKNRPLYVENLILPLLKNYSGDITEIELNKLRQELINQESKNKSKIFINRSDEDGRKIILSRNQYNYLLENNFKIIEMKNIEPQFQLEIFSNAQIIIAAHGAALSWIFACNKNTEIVEIFNGIYENDCYKKLCKRLELKYKKIYGIGIRSTHRWADPNIRITDNQLQSIVMRL